MREEYEYRFDAAISEPLSFEDERALVLKWRTEQCQASRDRLVKQYLCFAVKITSRKCRARGTVSQDIIMRTAHDALLLALDKFDVSREFSRVSTVIPFYVTASYRRVVKEDHLLAIPPRDRKDISIMRIHQTDMDSDGGETGILHSLLSGLEGHERPWVEEEERRNLEAALAEALSSMTKRLQEVIRLHYVENLTFADIAEKGLDGKKMTRERVRQLHVQAIRHLRGALARRGVKR